MTMIRTYTELSSLKTFEERFRYLTLKGNVGVDTFGYDRYLNQVFYRSKEWKRIRDKVILRDMGCDLGIEGYEIRDKIIIHHMNPITIKDLDERNPDIFNPEYLIVTSHKTHNAIHYGADLEVPFLFAERSPNDTCPWKH